MGKVKRLELWLQLYRTSLPVWDLENFRPMDFCWHECTNVYWGNSLAPRCVSFRSSKRALKLRNQVHASRHHMHHADKTGSTANGTQNAKRMVRLLTLKWTLKTTICEMLGVTAKSRNIRNYANTSQHRIIHKVMWMGFELNSSSRRSRPLVSVISQSPRSCR